MPKIIHTIGSESYEHDVPTGSTPLDFVIEQNPTTKEWQLPTVCIYKGKYPLREHWSKIELEEDDILYFCECPQGGGGGGGSNPFKMIVNIFVVALSLVAASLTAGMSIFLSGGLLAGMGTVAGAVVGAAVLMGGQMLTGAMFGSPKVATPRMPSFQAEAISPTYSWNPTGNTARLFQQIPECFGRMKITPDYIARQWSQYSSNDMYVYVTYGLGRGTVTVEKLYLGETLFWENGSITNPSYSDARVQIVPPGGRVTLYPDNVETSYEVAGQELFAPNTPEGGGSGGTLWIGPFPLNSPGTVCSEALFDFVLPQGLGWISDDGKLQEHLIKWTVEIRRINDEGAPISGWQTAVDGSMQKAIRTPQRITHRVSFVPARWEARARRTSDTSLDLAGRILEVLQWAGMRAILPGSLTYNQTAIALMVKATNEISQSAASNFSAIITRNLPGWNRSSKTWSSPRPTRSFADAMAYVLKSPYGGRLTDKEIDLDKLYAIDERLRAKNWTFDTWLDGTMNMFELVQEWCGTVLVIPRLGGEVVSFVEEAANRPVRAEFSPYNICRGSMSEFYETATDDAPDDVLISYMDEAVGFVGRDVRAIIPGSRSTNPVSKTVTTIIKRDHAHKYGVYLAACNRFRRIGRTFEVEGLGRILVNGDIINVNHPQFDDLLAISVEWWDEEALTIGLAAPLVLEGGDKTYYVKLTSPQGQSWGPVKLAKVESRQITFDAADYALVLFNGSKSPFIWITSGTYSIPTVCIIQEGKPDKCRLILKEITPVGQFRYRLTGYMDDSRVYTQNIPTPPWEFRQNLPDPGQIGNVTGLKGTLLNVDGKWMLTLGWLPVAGALGYEVELAFGSGDWQRQGRVLGNLLETEVIEGRVRARVAAVRDSQTAWASWEGNTTATIPSSPIPVLQTPYTAAVLRIGWTAVPNATSYTLLIKSGSTGTTLKTVNTSALLYEYSVATAITDGGPFRSLQASLTAKNNIGTSSPTNLSVSDPAPIMLTGVVVTATETTITITADPGKDEVTGYIAVRLIGPDFTSQADVVEHIISELPTATFEVGGEGVYYVSIAAKDNYFDVTQQTTSLQFSRVYMVTIQEPTPEV